MIKSLICVSLALLHIIKSTNGLQCYFCVHEDTCTHERCTRAKNALFDPSDPAAYIGKELPTLQSMPRCQINPTHWAGSRYKRECGTTEVCGEYKYDFVIDVAKYEKQPPSLDVSFNSTFVMVNGTGTGSPSPDANLSSEISTSQTKYNSNIRLYGCVPKTALTADPKKNMCSLKKLYSTKEETLEFHSISKSIVHGEHLKFTNNGSTCWQCKTDFCNHPSADRSSAGSVTMNSVVIVINLFTLATLILMSVF